MIKYFENKTWLLEISSCKISTNVIIHKKDKCKFWLRFGWMGKYFSLELFGQQIFDLDFKKLLKL